MPSRPLDEEPTGDESLDDLFDKYSDLVKRLLGVRPPEEPFFLATEIPFPKGKVVRLDAAIMAAHLYAAKVHFRSFASVIRERVEGMEKRLKSFVARSIAISGAYEFVRGVLSFVIVLAQAWDAETLARDFERKIRAEGVRARRELIALTLSQSVKRRSTRRVWSRHGSKKQRRPNKSWRQKRARKR